MLRENTRVQNVRWLILVPVQVRLLKRLVEHQNVIQPRSIARYPKAKVKSPADQKATPRLTYYHIYYFSLPSPSLSYHPSFNTIKLR
ncbi:hypothetical protein KQX54_021186 [Cotesia glomerata]|uniref:Uncharacterized protein n=1 Tax=Cotesia glomerata TaxID=32391 RepID=A0AAV7JAE3_COTGL|nr:hypothetical protein KQX54_021186 [Cotesia glomerata]